VEPVAESQSIRQDIESRLRRVNLFGKIQIDVTFDQSRFLTANNILTEVQSVAQ